MLNKVCLIGRVGQDPIDHNYNGKPFYTFSLATSKTYTDTTGGKRENTQWHNICVYNQHLYNLISNFIKKGSNIYLEGEIQYTNYKDKDNIERKSTKIVVNYNGMIELVGGSPKNTQISHGENTTEQPNITVESDEIPF